MRALSEALHARGKLLVLPLPPLVPAPGRGAQVSRADVGREPRFPGALGFRV